MGPGGGNKRAGSRQGRSARQGGGGAGCAWITRRGQGRPAGVGDQHSSSGRPVPLTWPPSASSPRSAAFPVVLVHDGARRGPRHPLSRARAKTLSMRTVDRRAHAARAPPPTDARLVPGGKRRVPAKRRGQVEGVVRSEGRGAESGLYAAEGTAGVDPPRQPGWAPGMLAPDR